MTHAYLPDPGTNLDLVLRRDVPVSPGKLWKAWTVPEHVRRWFAPAPWKTVDCEIDLRPGGVFRTVMRSPEGQDHPNVGCYLEVVENRRLVWTTGLLPGFRPIASPVRHAGGIVFTAAISLEPHGAGTRYVAHAMHRDAAGCRQHDERGFHQGWGKALDQLVEVAATF